MYGLRVGLKANVVVRKLSALLVKVEPPQRSATAVDGATHHRLVTRTLQRAVLESLQGRTRHDGDQMTCTMPSVCVCGYADADADAFTSPQQNLPSTTNSPTNTP
ncbi:unnamed protein product [Nippostrongylus brasiliensis]|uniref:Uncharacterized protein n=1 Tax=Nippostrongylus brasiliensis TaxID=27835 RepID=A0A0N4XEE0_NIPBR|nr:unnamed protein product [Nippostrongylus brasiliensis]